MVCTQSNCIDCRNNYQTCVRCSSATGYYLQGTVCKTQTMLVANEGINTAAGTIVPCSTGFCFDCKANYQTCLQCDTGSGYYLQGMLCKNQAMLLAYEGINSMTGTIVPCVTSNCLDCKADYLNCIQLGCTPGYYLHTGRCKSEDQLGVNEGIHAAAGTIVPCATQGCLDCKSNYQMCILCDAAAAYYRQGGVCKTQAMLLANEGINAAAGTIEACAANNCLYCKADYQICVGCDIDIGYYRHGAVCKNQGMLAANEGINMAAGTIVGCSTSNCLDCKANYQTCVLCSTAIEYYLHGTVCKNRAMLGANEGINSGAGTVVPCATAGCLDCKTDYQTCLQCDTGSGHYLHEATSTCKTLGMLTANQGINIATGTVVECSVSHCYDCKSNYQICQQCDGDSGFYLNGAVCIRLKDVESGFGLNTTSQRIESCKTSGCLNCMANNIQKWCVHMETNHECIKNTQIEVSVDIAAITRRDYFLRLELPLHAVFPSEMWLGANTHSTNCVSVLI